jgi:hypothetical protein
MVKGKNIENMLLCNINIADPKKGNKHFPSLSLTSKKDRKRKEQEEAQAEESINVFALIMMIKYFFFGLNILAANWFCINYDCC